MSANTAPSGIPVCDLHLDTVLEIQGGADLARGNPEGHVDLARMRLGGAGLMAFACFLPSRLPPGRAFREARTLLDLIDRTCRQLPEDLQKVDTAAEAEAAHSARKIAILPAIENGEAIESDLGKLEQLRQRGARYLTLTHARHHEWAASSGEPGSGPGGLTAFGREVVHAMEEMGMIVDVSHVHESTFWDVARIVRRPFIASHSCAAALCPLPRNLTDDQIKTIAASGGMVGINFFPAFLDPGYLGGGADTLAKMFADHNRIEIEHADDPARKIAETHRLGRATRARLGPPKADLELLVAHMLHVVDLVGVDHIGIGSDLDGVFDLPREVPDCSAYPRILARLARELGDEDAVRRIAWGNFLRVLRATEG